jgi:hypothetical protein
LLIIVSPPPQVFFSFLAKMGLFVSLNENNYFFLQFKGGQNGKDYLVFCSLM